MKDQFNTTDAKVETPKEELDAATITPAAPAPGQ